MKKATGFILFTLLLSTFSFAQTCQTFVSTDVPKAIPDLINVPVSSVLTVAGFTGNITDVNVVDLKGTHGFVYDLKISLEHPDGSTRILFEQICDNEANFDVKFDDEASTSYADFNPGAPVCNANTGLYYQPKESLSNFDGKTATGTWKLNILDSFLDDTGTLDSWSIEICTDGTLPLSLSNFSAGYLKEEEQVELNWNVTEAQNVSHFEIWRSKEENRDFEFMGYKEFRPGHNNYDYFDKDINQGQTYYYKLKIVDFDDSYQWSKIATATTGVSDLFTEIAPNPFTHNLSVKIAPEINDYVQFNLFDMAGKLIGSSAGYFSGSFEWDLSHLESGIYVFEMLSSSSRQVQRVIKM